MQLGAASAQAASPPSEHGAVAPSGGRKRRTAASPGTRSARRGPRTVTLHYVPSPYVQREYSRGVARRTCAEPPREV